MEKSASSESAANREPTIVSSEQLLGKQRQMLIEHNGERYCLRITANNKLILTK